MNVVCGSDNYPHVGRASTSAVAYPDVCQSMRLLTAGSLVRVQLGELQICRRASFGGMFSPYLQVCALPAARAASRRGH